MLEFNYWRPSLSNPKASLIVLWAGWKILLLVIAITSPGPGYDTSTSLDLVPINVVQHGTTPKQSYLHTLIRWDAIYFIRIVKRGYVHEQEWAFGRGFTSLVAVLSEVLRLIGFSKPFESEMLSGIIVAHISHLLSVLMLYHFSKAVFSTSHSKDNTKFALIASSLHVISPAGLFLSAPYSESLFALFSFSGFYCYLRSLHVGSNSSPWIKNLNILAAGLLLGFATTIRSNGLLNGIIFVHDIAGCAPSLLQPGGRFINMYRIFTAGCGGALVAGGFLFPQYLAYDEFCVATGVRDGPRPWCSGWFPAIYAWVQSHYWGMGFLRYWTFSNIPLFLLAMPMLYIMASSAAIGLKGTTFQPSGQPAQGADQIKDIEINSESDIAQSVIRALSLSQFALTLLALSNYHVQIITRLSSGYPVWYWWLASVMLARQSSEPQDISIGAQSIVQWMVIYAMVQGGLFASFLPPA